MHTNLFLCVAEIFFVVFFTAATIKTVGLKIRKANILLQ